MKSSLPREICRKTRCAPAHREETVGPWVWTVAVGPSGSQHPGSAEPSQDHSSRNSESVRISLKTQGGEHREDEIRTENYGHVCGKT